MVNLDEFRAVIFAGSAEGLKLLLEKDPTLVNMPWDDKNKRLLLQHLGNHTENSELIESILAAKPNLELETRDGNNILHIFAELGCKNQRILEYVLENAKLDTFKTLNHAGKTPLMIPYSTWGFFVFVPMVQETIESRFGNDVLNEILENQSSRIECQSLQSKYLSSTTDERKSHLNEVFTPKINSLSPVVMLSSLIGKNRKRQEGGGVTLNVRVFLNLKFMSHHIQNMMNDNSADFIANGILMVSHGVHAVNVFCIKSESILKVVLIDGTTEIDNRTGNLELKLQNELDDCGLRVEMIRSMIQIQSDSVSCKIISSYLSAKLSRLNIEDAKKFYDTLKRKADVSGGVKASDFPLWLGILTITQSISRIESELNNISDIDKSTPINKKGESITKLLERGAGNLHDPLFTYQEFKKANKTLERKSLNQREHALKSLSLTEVEIMKSMADILGVEVEELASLGDSLGEFERLYYATPKNK